MPSTLNSDNGVSSGSAGLKSTADSSGVLQLQTNGTTAVTVTATQNVGIGTTTPNSKLTSQTATTSTSVFSFATQLNNSYASNSSIASLGFHSRADVNDTGVGGAIAFSGGGTSDGSGNLIFCIKPTGNIATVVAPSDEKMRIDSSGNVQVNTTTRSNDEKLTVYQSGSAMGISVRTTGGPALGNYESADSTRAAYWTFGRDNASTGNFVFGYNGTLRGSINNSTGVYTSSSDSRLKKNITNLTYGLDEVMALRPVTYLMNEEEDTAKKHLGFIAQEVKTLVDEAVDDLIDPDTQFYMLDKGGLVPVLVKAIQEQQALITKLQADVTALKGTTP